MSSARPIILVVDDDPTMREFMRWCLAPLQPTMLEARNGVEALAILRSHTPHVAISDVHMPNMNGFELVAAAQADPKLSTVPFRMMSSLADRAAYRRAVG
ncbi:MAG: response regulator, partial [Betaproteobacteria bacterium]|nr:response regulator [Betaproteobacteria bacterium]